MKSTLVFFLAFAVSASAGQHVVIIDPGHGGGSDSGSQTARTLSASNNATTPGGLREKDLTLELSLEIKKQLLDLAAGHRGTRIDCVLTRSDDSNPDFAKRAALCAAGKQPPAAILSIHFNASENHASLGTLTVVHGKDVNANYPRDQALARGLTQATHEALVRFVPASKARDSISDAHLHNGGGSNFFYQLGLHPALKAVPKCFLEVEFIDRGDVEQELLKNRRQAFPVIARAIAVYLYDYCGRSSG